MDPTRFDTVIRTFGTHPRPTRRTVLATLAVLAAAGGSHLPATEARGKRCRRKSGKLKCNGACIDPQTDFSNCGTCGNVCGQGQTCQGGTCIGGGGCTPECAGKECGSDGCGGSCGSCADGQTCQGGTCVGGGGNACDGVDCPANYVCEGGNCVPAPDRCGGPTGICNADPTPCGTSATGETCGCERTVEDNNVCVNAGDNVCTGVECTSTQDCEDALGFHFFCQEAKTNAQGQFCGCGFGTATGRVCVPECDNPNVAFAAQERSHHGKARRRTRRAD